MTTGWDPAGSAQYGDGRVAVAPAPNGLPGTASCWLCGASLPTSAMVADGGPACSDVRWYCQDAQQCTWRWTTKSR
jgi:hypothetical protein